MTDVNRLGALFAAGATKSEALRRLAMMRTPSSPVHDEGATRREGFQNYGSDGKRGILER